MAGKRQLRYPMSPLLAKFPPVLIGRTGKHGATITTVSSHRQIADIAGLDQAYAGRLAQEGLTEQMADRIAIACGFHPAEIWGDLWWDRAPVPDPEPGGKFCGRHIQHAERERL